MPWSDPFWLVIAVVAGIAAIFVSFVFLARVWDIIHSAYCFLGDKGRSPTAPASALASMNRRDRFESLPDLLPLSHKYQVQRYRLEVTVEPRVILDRFERALLNSAPSSAQFGCLQGADPRFESLVIISQPTAFLQLFGWVDFVRTSSGFDWRVMHSERRVFKSPSFAQSHFASISETPILVGDALVDVAVAGIGWILSGNKSRLGTEAAEHLTTLLFTNLADALSAGAETAPNVTPRAHDQQDAPAGMSIRRRRV